MNTKKAVIEVSFRELSPERVEVTYSGGHAHVMSRGQFDAAFKVVPDEVEPQAASPASPEVPGEPQPAAEGPEAAEPPQEDLTP